MVRKHENSDQPREKDDDVIFRLTAKELSSQIASGAVDCVQLMEATLDRIELSIQPQLNPFILLKNRSELMELARIAADEAKRGQLRGWLHGIPTAVKDLVHVQGFPTTYGGVLVQPESSALQRAEQSDPHIARLQEAGVIVIGKTNVPALGLGSHTSNAVYGATRNAMDATRSAGGSSGGAAVAVATRCLVLADGTDMGGSLRNPAGWNGIYAMRPTAGLLSAEDDDPGPLPYPLSTPGPLARCADDLGYILETMAGREVWKYDKGQEVEQRPRRILWLGDWRGVVPMEKGVLDLCQSSLQRHCTVNNIAVDNSSGMELFPMSELWDCWVVIRSSVISQNCQDLSHLKSDWSDAKPELQWEMQHGSTVSDRQLETACASVQKFVHWLNESIWSQSYDAIALPSAQVWPFPVEQDYPKTIAGVPMELYHEWMKIMIVVSLAGLPCVTVPAGNDDNGLPMGIQLAGPRGSDNGMLDIARVYEASCRKEAFSDRRKVPDLGDS